MWKALLVDDEAVIVKGLRRLIDWTALNVQIVGEATDGIMAADMIEKFAPDFVVSDIRMPGLSGLELMERCRVGTRSPKFIFISGYEEFEYVHQALTGGAVDYLLKPVSAEALVKAVRKVLGAMEDSSAAALLRPSSLPLIEFFSQLRASREFADEDLYENFTTLLGGKADPVFRGLCFGLCPESAEKLHSLPYERQILQAFVVFNGMRDDLERSGYGCFLEKNDETCSLLGIFSRDEDPVELMRAAIEREYARTGYRLRLGMGRACTNAENLSDSCTDAVHAYELYYFCPDEIICWDGETHQPTISNEAFDDAVTKVFMDIVAKSPELGADVDAVLDIIENLHYGNRGATFNRVMVFTGDLCQLLYANRLLSGSFASRQDALQHRLEECKLFSELRAELKDYYFSLLPDIYEAVGKRSPEDILRVQRYIDEHYYEELSLKSLAAVARVSPHYFSAYFKAETGQNYKAYLTKVRMDHAMQLVLNSDLKTYEIAEKVGYNNVRRFTEAFRSTYGMSPADYRKNHSK